MTRKEYMRELEEKLDFMEEDARRSVLDFCEETLDDRMEDGMDEETAVAAMESPGEMARRLRVETGAAQEKARAEEKISDEAMRFSSLAGSVLKQVEKTLENVTDTLDQAVDTACQAQAACEEAMETANGYTRKTYTCPGGRLRAARLDTDEMPIRVKPSQDGNVTLIYNTCEDDPYIVEEADGVLVLRREERKDGGKGSSFFSMWGGFIRIGRTKVRLKDTPPVELFVPQNELMDVEAHSVNASVKMRDVKGLCGVTIKTSNSRIALENISCKTLAAASSNARVTLESVEAKAGLDAKTSNSRLEANGAVSGGGMTLTTSNGRLTASGCRAQGELRLATSNGSIEAHGLSGAAVSLTTSNGNISGALPGSQREWRITSGTSNGHNSLPPFQEGDKPLNVHTSNGNISLRFEE